MMLVVPRICARFPWLVLLAVIALGYFASVEIWEDLYAEPDLTKFLPGDLTTVKADDYYRQNFNYQDVAIIGLEPEGSVWDPLVLRNMEQIVISLQNAAWGKKFPSIITGKDEIAVLPVGIDGPHVQSVANLEDVIVDKSTGALITGSVIQALKDRAGIVTPPGNEYRLPVDDADLLKIIPPLRAHVMADPLLRGFLVSEDGKAALIRVPVVRKWDIMRRFVRREFGVALSERALTRRFQGEDSDFRHSILGRRIDGVLIDHEFIAAHVRSTRRALRSFLLREYAPVLAEVEPLASLAARSDAELTAQKFQKIMAHLESAGIYQRDDMPAWEGATQQFYGFMLATIDPFSRDNLQYLLFDTEDVIDMQEVSRELEVVLAKHDRNEIETYIAGYPVVIAMLSSMMGRDMGRMLPFAIIVVIIVLQLSFRNFRGIAIPFCTVALSVVFALATMALTGTPMTITSFILPIVLLAVGTAYGIHILNRFNQAWHEYDTKLQVIEGTYRQVGLAVAMAALTTCAGFLSLTFSSLLPIVHFGLFAALGVGYALLLTFTLTPALLAIWPKPSDISRYDPNIAPSDRNLIVRLGMALAHLVIRHPKLGLTITAILGLTAAVLTTQNRFEGSPMYNFLDDNPLRESDAFINGKLTGTYAITMMMKFRPQVRMETPGMLRSVEAGARAVNLAWRELRDSEPRLEYPPFDRIIGNLGSGGARQIGFVASIEERLKLLRELLDEEFRASADDRESSGAGSREARRLDSAGAEALLKTPPKHDAVAANAAANPGGLDSLDDLLDSVDDDPTAAAPPAGSQGAARAAVAGLDALQIAGLAELRKRMGVTPEDGLRFEEFALLLRQAATRPKGQKFVQRVRALQDVFAVNMSQPAVLHKLERLTEFAYGISEPQVVIEGRVMKPVGRVITPADTVRKNYRVLFHDGDPAFDRLPNVNRDGLDDPALTERTVIAGVLSQAMSSDRDAFTRSIRPRMDEFAVRILLRSGETAVVTELTERILNKAREIFPPGDPYIESIIVGGAAPRGVEITRMIAKSQVTSIAAGIGMVGIICLFLYRSFVGALLAMIPLTLTVLFNFGLVAALGIAISAGTTLVASIAIGTGVDYTIHFLERYRHQRALGDDPEEAYLNTMSSSGQAILLNALAVALGFAVLLGSEFRANINMGIMMIGTMAFSSLAALTTLPALILVFNPRFVTRGRTAGTT